MVAAPPRTPLLPYLGQLGCSQGPESHQEGTRSWDFLNLLVCRNHSLVSSPRYPPVCATEAGNQEHSTASVIPADLLLRWAFLLSISSWRQLPRPSPVRLRPMPSVMAGLVPCNPVKIEELVCLNHDLLPFLMYLLKVMNTSSKRP